MKAFLDYAAVLPKLLGYAANCWS